MSKIDDVGSQLTVGLPLPAAEINANQEGGAKQQIFPPYSALSAAQEALAEIDDSALQETMEEMSLTLGTRIREQKRKDENQSLSSVQESLSDLVAQMEDEALEILVQKFEQLGSDDQNPLTLLQRGQVPVGAMIAVLARLIGDKSIEDKRRRRLEQALGTLLGEYEDWELQLFAFLEMGQVSSGALAQLRALYQRQGRDEQGQGMGRWFAEVQGWSDRRQRIRVLIRALSFDLSRSGDSSQQVRLAVTIGDLQRLLLFLCLEDHSHAVAQVVGLTEEQVLDEVLQIIEQRWLYPEWVTERLQLLELSQPQSTHYLRRMRELLQLLPDPCFTDQEQKNQILNTLLILQDQLNETDE